jgi:hypothetical protein
MSETLYRVEESHGEDFTFPVRKAVALDQVRNRIDHEPLGNPLRIVRIDYRLDPDAPPEPYTIPVRTIWRATVLRFPEIGSLGVYVRKPDSEHCVNTPAGAKGNAADWSPPPRSSEPELIKFLWDVFDYHRAQGALFERSRGREGLPISEVITRDKIATRAQGWTVRPYTGVFHATHEHSSAYPLLPVCL